MHALLARIQFEQGQMHTLQADFRMMQQNELLADVEESSGEFFYQAPDQVRWEYATPHPLSVLIRGREMTTWYRDLDRAEKAVVGRYSDRVIKYLNATNSIESLLEYFSARVVFSAGTEPYLIELQPRYSRIAKRMQSMSLWIDRQAYLPVSIRFVAADGDVTELHFSDLKVNQPIPEQRFELELPPGVKVSTTELDRGAE